ncbi:hypothetical protein FRX31_031586, partial [Thalictrum thalictroides]
MPSPPVFKISYQVNSLINVYEREGWWPAILLRVDRHHSHKTHYVRFLLNGLEKWVRLLDVREHVVFLGRNRWRAGLLSDINR